MESLHESHVINISDKAQLDSSNKTEPETSKSEKDPPVPTRRHKLTAVLATLLMLGGTGMIILGMATNDWSLMSLKQPGGDDLEVKVGLFQVCVLGTCKYWNDVPETVIKRNRDAVRAVEALAVIGAVLAIVCTIPTCMGAFQMFTSRGDYLTLAAFTATLIESGGAIYFISCMVWNLEVHETLTDTFGYSFIVSTLGSVAVVGGGFLQYTYFC